MCLMIFRKLLSPDEENADFIVSNGVSGSFYELAKQVKLSRPFVNKM